MNLITFPRLITRPLAGGGGAAVPWYLAGGIPLANCIAAYAPKGAASLAASYVNLVNPGTNDATPGTAPTWDAVNGWKFAAASSQYLTTGIIPVAGGSAIVQVSNLNRSSERMILAEYAGGGQPDARFQISVDATRLIFYNGQGILPVHAFTSAILAIGGQKGYLDGAQVAGTMGAWSGTAVELYIGARNNSGTPVNYLQGYIQYLSIYNITLTAPQVLVLTNAISANP